MVFISTEKTIETYLKSKKPEARVMALYMKAKGVNFDNQGQVNNFYKRNIRAAKDLAFYPLDKIIQTIQYVKENADYKWTLESVCKHVDEDLEVLSGKKPIIILTNGERIYDTKRITELEKLGKIYYSGKEWHEKKNG